MGLQENEAYTNIKLYHTTLQMRNKPLRNAFVRSGAPPSAPRSAAGAGGPNISTSGRVHFNLCQNKVAETITIGTRITAPFIRVFTISKHAKHASELPGHPRRWFLEKRTQCELG